MIPTNSDWLGVGLTSTVRNFMTWPGAIAPGMSTSATCRMSESVGAAGWSNGTGRWVVDRNYSGRRLRAANIGVGGNFADIVTANRFVTDLSDQDSLNRVWAEYFGDNKPTTTTVQVVQLATDPRCLIEINAIAVVG